MNAWHAWLRFLEIADHPAWLCSGRGGVCPLGLAPAAPALWGAELPRGQCPVLLTQQMRRPAPVSPGLALLEFSWL